MTHLTEISPVEGASAGLACLGEATVEDITAMDEESDDEADCRNTLTKRTQRETETRTAVSSLATRFQDRGHRTRSESLNSGPPC